MKKTFLQLQREKAKAALRPVQVNGGTCYLHRASASEIQHANTVADSHFVTSMKDAGFGKGKTTKQLIDENIEAVGQRRQLFIAAAFLCDENGGRLYSNKDEFQELVNILIADPEAVTAVGEFIQETYGASVEDTEKNLEASDSEDLPVA